MRLAFFGTPQFAVPSLRALVGEGFDVAVVVTQPDRPQGRSRSTLVPPPVKVVALEEGIQVLQPEKPSDSEFMDALTRIQPELGVVVAYGHILKPALLALPPRGLINVHASLLPALRGAAPIQHAILRGLEETGVSIMQIEAGLDSGPVLLRAPTPISADETAGELTERLAELGALALIEALAIMETGASEAEPQDEALASYAPKITRELARIDWSASAATVARLARALDPKPGAWCEHHGRELKLFGPKAASPRPAGAVPGQVVEADPAFAVATSDGVVHFLDVQPAGKPRLAAQDWVRGRGVAVGDHLT